MDHVHCFHIVGLVKRSVHGRFAPPAAYGEMSAHRCCHCGEYQPTHGSFALTPDEIVFDRDCEPKEGE